ncbi:MAG: hypothetical protein KAY24_11265 [Candidatus Eisenbacteria sp.]|nr:hypothetical protein [Candidatus Eisenbacteria bacterium]
MSIKRHPNRRLYIEALRRMTPEARLSKSFELTAFARQLFLHGLRRSFPELSDDEIRALYLERLGRCHNRNY